LRQIAAVLQASWNVENKYSSWVEPTRVKNSF
jgi:hypothetical protein